MTGRELFEDADLRTLFQEARTIAVLGAHPEGSRAASYVPAYLHRVGYRVIAVNPLFAGVTMFGEATRATLAEIEAPVDLVNVFRRPDALMDHLPDLRAMTPRPRAVWLQLGISHGGFAHELRALGLDVVQNRCASVDHRRLAPRSVGPRHPLDREA